MKILIVEDYQPLLQSLAQGLKENGYAVDAAADGDEGLWYATTSEYDVIVLDLMLPGMDGLEILGRLRTQGNAAQVLVLTAKDSLRDRVTGLDKGADDYLVKPFEFSELLARIRALVRRKYEVRTTLLQVGDLTVDPVSRSASMGGRVLDLSAKEYAILEVLAMNRGRVVSRKAIWESIYDFAAEPASNVIDVFIGRLRRKLESSGEPRILHTRRGHGYILAEDA